MDQVIIDRVKKECDKVGICIYVSVGDNPIILDVASTQIGFLPY